MRVLYQIKIFNSATNETYKIVWAEKMEDVIDKYFAGLYVAYETICSWNFKFGWYQFDSGRWMWLDKRTIHLQGKINNV